MVQDTDFVGRIFRNYQTRREVKEVYHVVSDDTSGMSLKGVSIPDDGRSWIAARVACGNCQSDWAFPSPLSRRW